MPEKRVSLQKYAMVFGTFMGVYWIFKFLFLPLAFNYPLFIFVYLLLTIAVPFMGYRFVGSIRDHALGGEISFVRAWVFQVTMYLFAALLTAVAHFIFYRFFENGMIIESLTQMIALLPADDPAATQQAELGNLLIELLRSATPIELTMQQFSSNIIYCSLLSLVTAPFVVRKKPQSSAL